MNFDEWYKANRFNFSGLSGMAVLRRAWEASSGEERKAILAILRDEEQEDNGYCMSGGQVSKCIELVEARGKP